MTSLTKKKQQNKLFKFDFFLREKNLNGANRMYFYSYELKKLNQNSKSDRIQNLIEKLVSLDGKFY